jgi:hypothetical protein
VCNEASANFSASAKILQITFCKCAWSDHPWMDGPGGGGGDCWQAQPEPGTGRWNLALELLTPYFLQGEFYKYFFSKWGASMYEVKRPP